MAFTETGLLLLVSLRFFGRFLETWFLFLEGSVPLCQGFRRKGKGPIVAAFANLDVACVITVFIPTDIVVCVREAGVYICLRLAGCRVLLSSGHGVVVGMTD